MVGMEEASSLRKLTHLVGRDIKNVSRATTELRVVGILDFILEGRAKRPAVHYD
jgi:predicted transcriptional regulator